jgi:hypothetical protein
MAEATRLQESRNKLNAADLANCKEVADAIPAGNREPHEIGVIVGFVRGLSYRNNPNDPTLPAVGLVGAFKGIPSDPKRPTIVSPVVFLPTGIQSAIIEAVRGNSKAPIDGMPAKGKAVNVETDKELRIAVLIGIQKSNSPIGYTFVAAMEDNISVESPLSALEADGLKLLGKSASLTPLSEEAPRLAAATQKTPEKKSSKRKSR